MKRISLVFLLCFYGIPLLYTQPDKLKNEHCDYREAFGLFKSRDSVKTIYDPHLLYKMGVMAYAADELDYAKVYLARIFQQEQYQDSLIYYQALAYGHFIFEEKEGMDTLDRKVSTLFGPEHELLAVIDLVKADFAFRKRQKMQYDSIITSAIGKIENKLFYRNIIAVALQDVSRFHFDQSRIDESMEAAHRLRDFTNVYFEDCSIVRAGTLITLGRRHSDAGSLDSAAYYFEHSLDLVRQYHPWKVKSLAMAAINLAQLKGEQGFNMEALDLLKALEIDLQQDSAAAGELYPKVYNLMAGNYNDMGNNHKAIECYRKSILTTEQISPDKTINKLVAYSNIANEFIAIKALDLAETYNQKALDIALELLGEEHRFTAIILMKMGTIGYEKGDYETCEAYFDRSLAVRKKLYDTKHSSLGNIYLNYSTLYRDQKEFEKALEYLALSIDQYRAHMGEQYPNLAKAYVQQSINEFYLDNLTEALTALENAKKALGYSGDFKTCSDPLLYLDIVDKQAVFQLQQLDKTDEGDLDKIIGFFEHGRDVFDYHIGLTENPADLSEMASDYYGLFQNYAWSLLLKAEKNRSRSHLEKAYEITNKAKNLSLYESLSNRSQLLFSNVPDGVKNRLRELKSVIRSLDQTLAKVGPRDEVLQNELLDSLNLLQKDLDLLHRQIQTDYPAYSRLKNTKRAIDIKAIIPPKGSGEAIVDFLVLDSLLISFVAFEGKLETRQTRINEAFSAAVHDLLRHVARRSDLYQGSSMTLQPLIAPFELLPDGIRKVTIIPDKYLFIVPFELLNFRDKPLLEHFAVSYTNSASILQLQNEIKAGKNKHVFSGFAPDYSDQVDTSESKLYAQIVRSGNWALPFAAEELTYISDLLDGKAYFGKEAVKAQCFEALKNSRIVHLSMHAEADNDAPMNSRFIFNTGSDDERKNLLLYELYNLQASSGLVVLSACETGAGSFHGGEGVRSLGNGFLYAGVPSVVMSLWKVPDESTSKIMKSFYRFLKEGQTKSEALKRAKLHYLENTIAPEQKHPYYWAGFILSGNDEPVDLSSDMNWKWYLVFGIVVLALVFFLFKKN